MRRKKNEKMYADSYVISTREILNKTGDSSCENNDTSAYTTEIEKWHRVFERCRGKVLTVDAGPALT